MSDIALIGERTFLYEKLFADLGVSFQFLSPAILGSPFLPTYKMVMIPTGFANSDYSKTLPALQRMKSNISDFVHKGGVLTVFGPMVPDHSYDWLPLSLRYVCELSSQTISPSVDECSCLLCTSTPECDGYLVAGEGFKTVLRDEKGRSILVRANFGKGLIVATSVHEFPAAEYIKWALSQARPAKL
ncbi:MAG: hypothetical protein PHS80_08175 [Methanothrix sp.]|nr:hypothetical protein [Methanothrix sp.]MDD4446799.1 hypothetical protein [Methanothrix sp.]